MNPEIISSGIIWYLVFLFSLVLHEAAHAFTAFKLGDRTGFDAGQVSLNPIPHLRREVFGTVVVPILSFILSGWMIGWASTPIDPTWERKYPKRSAWVSLAGPAANFILMFIAALSIHIGYQLGIFYEPESISFSALTAASQGGIASSAATILSIFFSLNLILFLFNMLPIPSFDGSHIAYFFTSDENIDRVMGFIRNPRFAFLGLIIAWNLFEYIFSPIHLIAVNLIYPGVTYG